METNVIQGNLEKMTGEGEYSMPEVLARESMGGNAGYWKGHMCMGANFYFDPKTGEIQAFGNLQDIPDEIRNRYTEANFKIALNKKWKRRIVRMTPYGDTQLTKEAEENILQAVNEYNREYGFTA